MGLNRTWHCGVRAERSRREKGYENRVREFKHDRYVYVHQAKTRKGTKRIEWMNQTANQKADLTVNHSWRDHGRWMTGEG